MMQFMASQLIAPVPLHRFLKIGLWLSSVVFGR
jgi:hypothetical protein